MWQSTTRDICNSIYVHHKDDIIFKNEENTDNTDGNIVLAMFRGASKPLFKVIMKLDKATYPDYLYYYYLYYE